MKVTIIDDDRISIFIAEKVLKLADESIEVTSFISPLDALNHIKSISSPEHLPDLILLDLNMPVINGFQFLENLYEANEKLKSIKISILTSSCSVQDIEKSNTFESVFHFISKPLKLAHWKELKAKLEN
ncbi:MAG: response regulator [Cytophagales bacterium]|nr:MAG: response regulator [Cytophagales bacterium]